MIKVYHLIKGLGRGGAEMLLPETLRVHDEQRFAFRYAYFLPHKGQVAEDLREMGVTVDLVEGKNNLAILAQTRKVAQLARGWGADVIHCHLPIAGVVGRIVGKLTGLPVVYTEHNKQERYHVLTRQLNLRTLAWNRHVIACSDDVKDSINRHVDMAGTQVQSIQNGVNTNRFSREVCTRDRAQLPLPEEKIVIGTVCVFRTQKRLHHWLTLAQRLYTKNRNLHFVIVGDGPEEDRLREQIRAQGMEAAVSFPGRIQEVRPWLAAMDIYLMTSEFEGLPIAMLEAMSMELPVVATRAGGIGEVIDSGVNGFLEEVPDWERLEAPLQQLVDDPQLRQRLGTAARQRIISDFSVRRMVRELEEVYEQVTATVHVG
jgi:glycosyltransferase involved in cell wall biosynthesis